MKYRCGNSDSDTDTDSDNNSWNNSDFDYYSDGESTDQDYQDYQDYQNDQKDQKMFVDEICEAINYCEDEEDVEYVNSIYYETSEVKIPAIIYLLRCWENYNMTVQLLKIGGNPNLKDNLGNTVLDYAFEKLESLDNNDITWSLIRDNFIQVYDCILVLVNYGAKLSKNTEDISNKLDRYYDKYCSIKRPSIYELELHNKWNYNFVERNKPNTIFTYIYSKKWRIVTWIVRKEGNPNIYDSTGKSLLDYVLLDLINFFEFYLELADSNKYEDTLDNISNTYAELLDLLLYYDVDVTRISQRTMKRLSVFQRNFPKKLLKYFLDIFSCFEHIKVKKMEENYCSIMFNNNYNFSFKEKTFVRKYLRYYGSPDQQFSYNSDIQRYPIFILCDEEYIYRNDFEIENIINKLKILIKYGADINIVDEYGRTPLNIIVINLVRIINSLERNDSDKYRAYQKLILFFIDNGACTNSIFEHTMALFHRSILRIRNNYLLELYNRLKSRRNVSLFYCLDKTIGINSSLENIFDLQRFAEASLP